MSVSMNRKTLIAGGATIISGVLAGLLYSTWGISNKMTSTCEKNEEKADRLNLASMGSMMLMLVTVMMATMGFKFASIFGILTGLVSGGIVISQTSIGIDAYKKCDDANKEKLSKIPYDYLVTMTVLTVILMIMMFGLFFLKK